MKIKSTFFSLWVTLIFAALIISSCNGQETQVTIQKEEIPQPISYLALGDSYTIGQGVQEAQRWPNQLVDTLRKLEYEVENLKIIATTGWTTSNLLAAMDEEESFDYNMVSLLIGVNNQYQKKDFALYEEEFVTLLNRSIEIAGSKDRVFVVSIPDYGVTPFGSSNSETIGKELDAYNAYAEQICLEREIPFIDITGISRTLGNSQGALASDNLHPSGGQYFEWVKAILPDVIDILDK